MIADLNLRILNSRYFDGYADGYATETHKKYEREVNYYELELYLASDGGISINGELVKFKKGEINFRKPGQIVYGVMPYRCIFICFDVFSPDIKIDNFDMNNSEKRQPNNPDLDKIPDKIKANPEIEKIIMKIHKSFLVDIEKIFLKGYLYLLLAELEKVTKSDNERNENLYIRKAIKYIEERYCQEINVLEIAEYLCITPAYFHNIFKKSLKLSPKKYINSLRIEKAKYLLQTTNLPIDEIGFECGFLNHVYFSYAFRKTAGITATEYRKI